MDSQDLRTIEDPLVHLCSYREVMSSSTAASAQESGEDTGDVPHRDTTQIQTAVARSHESQHKPVSNRDSISSHTLSAGAATAETDIRSPKRRRSGSSGSLRILEVVKEQRYGASSEHKSREDAVAVEVVSGITCINPPSNETASSSCRGTDNWPKLSSAEEPELPLTKKRFRNVRPTLSLPNVRLSVINPLPETVPHRTMGSTAKEVNLPRKGQMPKECTLPPLAPRTGSITNARNRGELSLRRTDDLVINFGEPGIHPTLGPYYQHPPGPKTVLPGIFETRRWGFAKGGSDRAAVLVAGDRHPGPPLKPFDHMCYEDNALE